jgi:hypothetical protein
MRVRRGNKNENQNNLDEADFVRDGDKRIYQQLSGIGGSRENV